MAVFDTVYNPIETRLLREARLRGCRVIDGVAMFVGQAAAQFRLWTNLDPPTAIMRQVVIQRLSR
jgi:shikimate 5-dehydrogenase